MTTATDHIAAAPGDLYWRYGLPPHRGAKMLLLTRGCVCVPGNWTGEYGEQFIAWCPMSKRDKRLEAAIREGKVWA